MKSSFAQRPASAARRSTSSSIAEAGSSSAKATPRSEPRRPRKPRPGFAPLLVAALCLGAPCGLGCSRGEAESSVAADPSAAPSVAAATPRAPEVESFALLDDADDCVLGHRGITLDLGSPAAEARRGFSATSHDDVEWVIREGSRFGRFRSKRISYDLWIDRPYQSVALSAKVHGTGARHLAAYLDDQHLGIIRIDQDKTRIGQFPVKELELAPGRHRLSLTFLGKPGGAKGANLPQGEISWLNLAETHPKTATDTPPTRLDTFVNVALDDQPLRSAALRPRAKLHCPVWVPPDSHLRLSLGVWGQGKGQAEILVARDGEPPLSLGVYEVDAERGWLAVDEPLTPFAGQLVRLEFITHGTTGGARVAFGEPRIERTRPPIQEALYTPARRAIVVVLSGLSRKHAPPASRSHGLASLARFAQKATYFSGYRTPSTLTPSVVASLLTGKSPRGHGLEDFAARLPDNVETIAQRLRAVSGRAAFFTAVPTSFSGFGFDRGWEQFEAISPVHDRPATEPLTLAQQWLAATRNARGGQLAVVHLRGGHPPFDVPLERARELPPFEYGGDIDPRRAALQLAAIRARPRPQLRRLLDEDRTRLEALQRVALEKQDAALARLFRWLQQEQLWDDSLIVVMGDVTAGEPPEVPFAPRAPLGEDRLHAPLLVKWPGGALAAHETSHPVTTVDLSTTLLSALGVDVPKDFEGVDLRDVAGGRAALRERALYATGGSSYATRIGEWLLRGQFGSVPTLCQLGPDPSCVNDLLNESPLVAQSLWQWTYRMEREARAKAPPRAPLDPSQEHKAALTVWGYFE